MLRSMQSAAQFLAQPILSGLALVDVESPPAVQVVGVSASWRKLLMQAERSAPHLQVAAIEGEPGAGKQTLARYLFSHSPLAAAGFLRRDAREWLVSDVDPATLAGFLYLDRVDLLTPLGQGLLLGVLKSLKDRPPGRAVVLASSQTSLRQMAERGRMLPDLASALPPSASSFPLAPAPGRYRPACPITARPHLHPLPASSRCAGLRRAGPASPAQLAGQCPRLASVLETALLEATNGVIRAGDLALPTGSESYLETKPDVQPVLHAENLSLDAVILRHVRCVLDLNRGNKLRAARQLGISRSTLYRILGNETILAH